MKKIKEFLNKSTTQTKILIIVIISILAFISYQLWTEYKSGEIDIYIPYKESSIFLDNKKVNTTNYNNQAILLKNIYAGKHSIIVHTKGRYPWGKIINLKGGEIIKMHPFLMITKLTKDFSNNVTKLTKKEYTKIQPLFKKQNKNIIISNSGNVEIIKTKKNISAIWLGGSTSTPEFFCNKKCKKMVSIFTSKLKPIKTMGFYPKRRDVVIFSLGKSIYAIEIEKNGTQNFQPIYTGDNPYFAINNKDSILYIKDKGLIFDIKLN